MDKPIFTAKLANYFGWGNVTTDHGTDGWSKNVLCLKLGRYKVKIIQRREVTQNEIEYKGTQYTSDVEISGVKKYTEGETVINDLCSLLSLASFSQVVPFRYSFDGHSRKIIALGEGMYFRPLINIKTGNSIQNFLENTWITYRKNKRSRKLSAVIEMLTIAELPSQPLEVKLAQIFIVMENLKSTYAKKEGIPFIEGAFRDMSFPQRLLHNQPKLGFKRLLEKMLEDVCMKRSLKRTINLRNEIIHFGLSRKTYESLRGNYDYCQDLIREYLLRLLNFNGEYLLYSSASRTVCSL